MSLAHRYADIDLEAQILALIDSSMDTALEQTSDFPSEEAARVKRLAKSGLKSESFAREALDLARLHEELLPRGLDLERLERTIRNRDAIRSRLRKAQQLVQRLQVLSVLLGVDSYSDALDIYHSLKRHGSDQSLQTAVKELGRIFKRGKKEAVEEEAGGLDGPGGQNGPGGQDGGRNGPGGQPVGAPAGNRTAEPDKTNATTTLQVGQPSPKSIVSTQSIPSTHPAPTAHSSFVHGG